MIHTDTMEILKLAVNNDPSTTTAILTCLDHVQLKDGKMDSNKPYDWCCPDCQELDCECDPPRPKSKDHPQYEEKEDGKTAEVVD